MRVMGLAVVLVFSLVAAPLADETQAAPSRATVAVVFANLPLSDLVGPQPRDLSARAFADGMRQLGWVDGQNLTIMWRSAEGQPDRYAALATELVSLKVDVIVAAGGTVRAIRKATSTIPIVGTGGPGTFQGIQSLARPGGNVTGLMSAPDARFAEKRLELLKEAVPTLSRVAYLSDDGTTGAPEAAARALRITLVPIPVGGPGGLQPALASIERQRVDAIFVVAGPFFWSQRGEIIEFAARRRLPAMYPFDIYVRDGGLMSYGANYADINRRAAIYVDKILKGARPGDLPIEQPMKYELLINLKTAKALGLTIPATILLQADQVIE
jgi:putative tryptophan/tyrosine transport system substrate-binding protein